MEATDLLFSSDEVGLRFAVHQKHNILHKAEKVSLPPTESFAVFVKDTQEILFFQKVETRLLLDGADSFFQFPRHRISFLCVSF